jgi:hypothetical protein
MGAISANALPSVQMSKVTTVVGHFHKYYLGSGPTAGACCSTYTAIEQSENVEGTLLGYLNIGESRKPRLPRAFNVRMPKSKINGEVRGIMM